MKPEILDDDLEPKIEAKLFESAFSVEGLLFAILFLSSYLGYLVEHSIGLFCVVFSVPVSSIWQVLGSILWQTSFIRDSWRNYHLLSWLIMFVLFLLGATEIIKSDFLLFPAIIAIWNLASLAYIYICFFRKKLR